MAGFHLLETSERVVGQVTEELRTLGVQRIMPAHCTGAPQIAQIAEAFGDDYLEGGVGRVVEFEVGPTVG